MSTTRRNLVIGLLLAFLGVGMLAPFRARASEAGRRNTTYALGALTGLLAYKKQWIPAALAGVGTYVAYHNYQAAIDARHRRENYYAMRSAYGRGYNSGYYSHRQYGSVHHSRRYATVHHTRRHSTVHHSRRYATVHHSSRRCR